MKYTLDEKDLARMAQIYTCEEMGWEKGTMFSMLWRSFMDDKGNWHLELDIEKENKEDPNENATDLSTIY